MDNKGKVSLGEFQGILLKNRVYMTREDLKKIAGLFSEDGGESINYVSMSQQLGLHRTSLDFMQGQKAKNLRMAAMKLKALDTLSMTSVGFPFLEPIKKPPQMTERDGN